MIRVGGSTIDPAEVAAVLEEHPAVRSCRVIGVPDPDLGHVPHAIVELWDPAEAAELLNYARERLDPESMPRSIEVVPTPDPQRSSDRPHGVRVPGGML